MSLKIDNLNTTLMDFLIDHSKLSLPEVKGILIGNFSNLNKARGHSNLKCLFPNCDKQGVERSHLFAASFLRRFTEDGKFYSKSFYPNVSETQVDFSVEELGLNEALTFPGFCFACEQKFSFEQKGKINDAKDYFLQLFRTVCYEKRIVELEMAANDVIVNRIKQESTKKLAKYLDRSRVQVVSLEGANDIEIFFERREKILAGELKKLNQLYIQFLSVFNEKQSLEIVSLKIPAYIPVFINYIGNLRFKTKKRKVESNLVLNINPINSSETDLFFVDFKGKLTLEYLSTYDLTDVMQLVGELMCCSQSWVCNKIYWDNISDETKKEILRNRRFIQSPQN